MSTCENMRLFGSMAHSAKFVIALIGTFAAFAACTLKL